jgi:aconitate hydratase
MSTNTFQTQSQLQCNGKTYQYHSLPKLQKAMGVDLARLPYSLKILLENLLRFEDGSVVKRSHIEALVKWKAQAVPDFEIQFTPARVILQDFTGVPCVADLAAMRAALKRMGRDPQKVNPLQPVDLVVDHSVQVDKWGTADAEQANTELEFQRNGERYEFLKWGQTAFKNFRAAPPATGIVHQVNLEFLAQVAMTGVRESEQWIYPDTVVGTDSHTPMVNGLGVLGWGVGGIEAEAAMLGQPSSMLIPQVVGVRLKGKLKPGITATDLVLTCTEMLRKHGVVGKFVEYFGEGMQTLTIADRATIGNMSPEYGATVGIFPVDHKTIEYLRLTNRLAEAERAEAYYKEQGLWYEASTPQPEYSDILELDLGSVEPSLAGPARPQDRVTLSKVPLSFRKATLKLLEKDLQPVDQAALAAWAGSAPALATPPERATQHPDQKLGVLGKSIAIAENGEKFNLTHGSIVIAAITSCTNTSNPSVLVSAGLLARKAVAKGLKIQPWVKTSLGPGSRVVTAYLHDSGLLKDLEALHFNVVGYGCTTCIGNSGPLPPAISSAITSGNLVTASVLSGNRNFEARINPDVRANYLASPPLVVAYALAGNINIDLNRDPLGTGKDGKPVYLKDIWPKDEEVQTMMQQFVTADAFKKVYSDVFSGDANWKKIAAPRGDVYNFADDSTYIKEPPFFTPEQTVTPDDLKAARVLLSLGDSVTTDHISPAGSFSAKSDAGQYLISLGVKADDFNSYGSRRGNHEVMMRGTFANVRIRNLLVPGVEGGVTIHFPTGKQVSVFTAATEYMKAKIPTLVIAGKEYGSGSSRDWAAKGPKLLGVRAVIAESYERIHRSNLVGMGILPLQFMNGESVSSLQLTGRETFDIMGVKNVPIGGSLKVRATGEDGKGREFSVRVRIDTPNEMQYYHAGGLLPFMLNKIAQQ